MRIARIFKEVSGFYHICPDDGPPDSSDWGYNTKADAMRAAIDMGYTHARGDDDKLTKLSAKI